MRRWWKIAGAALLVPLGTIRGIVDAIGEVQTVKDLPTIKWLIHPYFSLGMFAGASVLGAWAFYDYRIKKEQPGFVGAPENKRRYQTQAIVGAVIVLALFIVAPLIYGHYHHRVSTRVRATVVGPVPEPPLVTGSAAPTQEVKEEDKTWNKESAHDSRCDNCRRESAYPSGTAGAHCMRRRKVRS